MRKAKKKDCADIVMTTHPAIAAGLLRPDDAALVYPLVRMIFPALERGLWMRAARRALRAGRYGRQGMLVARHGAAGRPCGVISFHCDPDMRLGRVLTAEHFVALTFGDESAVLEAFLPVLDAVARRAGCGAVRVLLPRRAARLRAALAARGHAEAGEMLSCALGG